MQTSKLSWTMVMFALAACDVDRLTANNPETPDPTQPELPTYDPVNDDPAIVIHHVGTPDVVPVGQQTFRPTIVFPTVVQPVDPDPPITGTLACDDGTTGVSWKDALSELPVAVQPGAALGAGLGIASATCIGQPTTTSNPLNTDWMSSTYAHNGGRWYFEASVEIFEPGWSQVGVFAPPADVWHMDAWFMDDISAAGTSLSGLGTVGVAVDLDAGAAFIFENGVLTASRSLLLLPGIGAFRAGGVSMIGNKIRFNFGDDPFVYAVPNGYSAWSGGAADASGNCTSDSDVPANPAPVVARGENNVVLSDATSFETNMDADTELVVLGVYDSGSESSWEWGFDANGNPIEVTIGPGANGSVLVEVNRPGNIALVLSAYEPTDWTVVPGANTTFASVSVYGFHHQSVTGLDPAVPVDIHMICIDGNGGNCDMQTGEYFPIAPFQWVFDTGGGDTQGFVNYIEAKLCLPLEVFTGAYEARRFTVD